MLLIYGSDNQKKLDCLGLTLICSKSRTYRDIEGFGDEHLILLIAWNVHKYTALEDALEDQVRA